MILIILFSTSISMIIVSKKRKQIEFIEKIVYMGQRIELMLKSTMPETAEILSIIKDDPKLRDINLDDLPLNDSENERILSYFKSLGRYDVDSIILITEEFVGYFKLLCEEYRKHYSEHYRIYISFGVFAGVLVSILIV